MKSRKLWAVLLGLVVGALDVTYTRSHPGAASLFRRDGPLVWVLIVCGAGVFVWALASLAWLGLRSALGHADPPYFTPDPNDTEQAAADAELQRINGMTDEAAAERAWRDWLIGERRREEARFVKRREWAGASRASMAGYVKAIRDEIALDRSMLDAEDPEDSLHGQVRRLEEELAWAEAEFDRMEQGRGR